MGSQPAFPRPIRNQGWNNCNAMREREWQDRLVGLRERKGERSHYVLPYYGMNAIEPNINPESFLSEDMLTRILKNVEGLDKALKEVKLFFLN